MSTKSHGTKRKKELRPKQLSKEPKELRSNLTPRQTDTILAALRYWQRCPAYPEMELAEEHGEPLTDAEIDSLCESMNFGKTIVAGEPVSMFVETIARMKTESEFGGNPPEAEDWICTLNDLIASARKLLKAKAETITNPLRCNDKELAILDQALNSSESILLPLLRKYSADAVSTAFAQHVDTHLKAELANVKAHGHRNDDPADKPHSNAG
jgi:hypothetical protein